MEEVRPGDTFLVEDLLDFSVEGSGWIEEDETGFDEGPVSVAKGPGGSFDSSHGGGSSISGEFSAVFSGEDLCPACDELLELEWLSNFVEESFQGDDHQKFLLNPSSQNGRAAHLCVPGKARTKRSRPLHSSWFSYRPVISPITSSSSSSSSSSSPQEAGTPGSSSSPARKVPKAKRKNEPYLQEGRTCLHCAATRTPQWRAGPMGPKTLCNACGVRYKSGKLAPEYRPAASPTFEPSQHSNSHRKVMELRQQKQLSAAHLLSEL